MCLMGLSAQANADQVWLPEQQVSLSTETETD